MTIAERIQALCKECHITQTDLEKELRFGKGTISKWNGKTAPSADKIMYVAEYFCVSVDYLLGRDERRLPSKNEEYQPNTIATHLNTDDLSEDELDEVANYIEFIRNKRKN